MVKSPAPAPSGSDAGGKEDATKRESKPPGLPLPQRHASAPDKGTDPMKVTMNYPEAMEATEASMKERTGTSPAFLSGGGEEDAEKQEAKSKEPGLSILSRHASAPDEGVTEEVWKAKVKGADPMNVAPLGEFLKGAGANNKEMLEAELALLKAPPLGRTSSLESTDSPKNWPGHPGDKGEVKKLDDDPEDDPEKVPEGPPLDGRGVSLQTNDGFSPAPTDHAAGFGFDAGYGWPPFGGLTPEMMSTMPHPMGGFPDPGTAHMNMMMYYQQMAMMHQQAWTTNTMMGMMGQHGMPPVPQHPAMGYHGIAEVEADTGPVRGQVWKLVKTSSGSRRVQAAIEEANGDVEKAELANELVGHVKEAYRCPHANHVLQICITKIGVGYTKFITDELYDGEGSAVKIARHKFGCRVLQRLLEHAKPEQVEWIVEELLKDAVELSKHAYANFVLQHVLDHASDEQKTRLVTLLTEEVASGDLESNVAAESNGSAVLQRAMECTLENGNHDAQVKLSHALIAKPELLAKMACSRHGHLTAKKALEVAEEPQKTQALSDLKTHAEQLKSSRYGRVLHRYLEELQEMAVTPTAMPAQVSVSVSSGIA